MKKTLVTVMALGMAGVASASTITFTGNGGSGGSFGNTVNFQSTDGLITGQITAFNSSGGVSTVSGFNLDGYGVSAGGYPGIQGNETLRINFTQYVNIGTLYLRQWEGPDDAKVVSTAWNGGTTTINITADNGGAFDTNEYVAINLTGVDYIDVTGVGTGTILGIPSVQFFVAGLQNVSVFTPPTPQVPVPGAVWLMGSGLAGLAGIARRRRA